MASNNSESESSPESERNIGLNRKFPVEKPVTRSAEKRRRNVHVYNEDYQINTGVPKGTSVMKTNTKRKSTESAEKQTKSKKRKNSVLPCSSSDDRGNLTVTINETLDVIDHVEPPCHDAVRQEINVNDQNTVNDESVNSAIIKVMGNKSALEAILKECAPMLAQVMKQNDRDPQTHDNQTSRATEEMKRNMTEC